MTQEYLIENSLNGYPFKDYPYAVFPYDCILDLRFLCLQSGWKLESCYFTGYTETIVDTVDTLTFEFTVIYIENSESKTEELQIPLPKSTAISGSYTDHGEGTNFRISVVFGEGINSLYTATERTVAFTSNLRLVDSALIDASANLTSVQFVNRQRSTYSNIPTTAYSLADNTYLRFHEGSNVSFDFSEVETANKVIVDVDRGAGIGLYAEDCGSGYVRTINGIAPKNGHMVLDGDQCHTFVTSSTETIINNTKIVTPRLSLQYVCRHSLCGNNAVNAVDGYMRQIQYGLFALQSYVKNRVIGNLDEIPALPDITAPTFQRTPYPITKLTQDVATVMTARSFESAPYLLCTRSKTFTPSGNTSPNYWTLAYNIINACGKKYVSTLELTFGYWNVDTFTGCNNGSVNNPGWYVNSKAQLVCDTKALPTSLAANGDHAYYVFQSMALPCDASSVAYVSAKGNYVAPMPRYVVKAEWSDVSASGKSKAIRYDTIYETAGSYWQNLLCLREYRTADSMYWYKITVEFAKNVTQETTLAVEADISDSAIVVDNSLTNRTTYSPAIYRASSTALPIVINGDIVGGAFRFPDSNSLVFYCKQATTAQFTVTVSVGGQSQIYTLS